MGELHFFREP